MSKDHRIKWRQQVEILSKSREEALEKVNTDLIDSSKSCYIISGYPSDNLTREIFEKNPHLPVSMEDCLTVLHQIEKFLHQKNLYKPASTKIAFSIYLVGKGNVIEGRNYTKKRKVKITQGWLASLCNTTEASLRKLNALIMNDIKKFKDKPRFNRWVSKNCPNLLEKILELDKYLDEKYRRPREVKQSE
jgi:hypothetical protein